MEPTNGSSIPEIQMRVIDVLPQDMNQREARPSSSGPNTSHIVPPGQLSLSLSLRHRSYLMTKIRIRTVYSGEMDLGSGNSNHESTEVPIIQWLPSLHLLTG
ncbi:hypothetical protein Patl1_24144 [Pistacia atlantica]|uniref:Uncharacterized protein n=1 Tax=Pistacia atlantica TaxID=434234 RepID=A0ACC0ZZ03_9ROSI|nr:hypothetical protein Patl1_24144 [Pistacia atlantica]